MGCTKDMNRKTERAFTLVELSIVLVILGLLVGGVLTGQSLIRASELRAIATEKDKFTTAFNAFRDKYFALPGDMKDAYKFWGSDCGTDTADYNDGCNGNGDGFIFAYAESNSAILLENLKAWEHLARAGLIEGSYDGVGKGNSGVVADPSNSPTSKFQSSIWLVNARAGDGGMQGYSNAYPYINSTYLVLGMQSTNGSWFVSNLQMTNSEAWNIDTKIDDGYATTGKMNGRWEEGTCADYTSHTATLHGEDPYGIQETAASPTGNCILYFNIK